MGCTTDVFPCEGAAHASGTGDGAHDADQSPRRGDGACACSHGETNKKLKSAILDAIRVLENTKKAFKSKQLEDLRKRLTGLLAEQ